jgi:plasmid rolling circle replication initiator protein Rep
MESSNCNRESLQKRAKCKYAQKDLLRHLIKLNTVYADKYDDTLQCSSTLIQNGDKITSRYCGHRWCRICNRIRTAKLMNGYENALEAMKDPYFVTLTIRNVKIENLRSSIKDMIATMRKIQDLRRKKKLPLMQCIRKIECTYNPDTDTYHPHFHLIIDKENVANELLENWLKRYPEQAEIYGQDKKSAFDPIELFKYFTKLTAKSKNDEKINVKGILIHKEYHYPEALDLIFRAIEGIRIIQPMGSIKYVKDDVEDVEVQTVEDVEQSQTVWIFHRNDWVDTSTGEFLTGYQPTQKEFEYSKRIRYFADLQDTT